MSEKKTMRKFLQAKREALSLEFVQTAALIIVEKIKQREDFSSATTIAVYASFQNEVPTRLLIEFLLAEKKTVVLPVIKNQRMEFYLYRENGMLKNRYGISEPDPGCSEKIDLTACDLIVVPGVAFDARGGRIGRGGGFYDRALAGVAARTQRPRLVGLAYDFQMIDDCYVEAHDVLLDEVIIAAE
jgi:5-formyltetrahydrofolate cyclo-ligase